MPPYSPNLYRMKIAAASFAAVILFSTCTPILDETGYAKAKDPGLAVTATVTTLAGSGSSGSAEGSGTAASFYWPQGIAVDTTGCVYVADTRNNKIRKVSTSSITSTFAGSGYSTSTDGKGAGASFDWPYGIAVDASGYTYVADNGSNKIRKVSPSGDVSTLAATESSGSAVNLYSPEGIAVDASGYIYVAETLNNKIRKISPAGVVSTLAGSGSSGWADGSGAEASFNRPSGIAVDASGYVYVADSYNFRIRKISPEGVVSTLAGSGSYGTADGSGTAASFDYPNGVAVDASGYVYVADAGNNKIRKVSPSGVVITLAGTGDEGSVDGSGTSASFYCPTGLAIDTSGSVYVVDTLNNKIRKITQTY
jgi:sugar lactone lactonase YvrE